MGRVCTHTWREAAACSLSPALFDLPLCSFPCSSYLSSCSCFALFSLCLFLMLPCLPYHSWKCPGCSGCLLTLLSPCSVHRGRCRGSRRLRSLRPLVGGACCLPEPELPSFLAHSLVFEARILQELHTRGRVFLNLASFFCPQHPAQLAQVRSSKC